MTINLDRFERWARWLALFLIIAAPFALAGTMIIYSGRLRIVVGAYYVISFLVGAVVIYALRWFRTDLPFAIKLIENSFYVMCANTVVVLIDEFITSGISAELVGGDAFLIGIYTFIGIKIFEVKRVSTNSQQTSEGSDG